MKLSPINFFFIYVYKQAGSASCAEIVVSYHPILSLSLLVWLFVLMFDLEILNACVCFAMRFVSYHLLFAPSSWKL